MAGSHEVRGSIPLGSTTCHRAGSQIRLVLRSGQQKPRHRSFDRSAKPARKVGHPAVPPPATLRTQHVPPPHRRARRAPEKPSVANSEHGMANRATHSARPNAWTKAARQTLPSAPCGPEARPSSTRQHPPPRQPPPRNDRGRLLSAAAPVSVTPLSRMRRTWPCRTRRRSTSHPRTAGSKTRSASAPARSHRRSGPSR